MKTRQLLLQTLERVARGFENDLERVVFVGGTVAALYEGAVDIRPTYDVDCVVSVDLSQYYALMDRLRARGFKQVAEAGAPTCRLKFDCNITVDVMPVDPVVLGFSNRWYPEAVKEAATYVLQSGLPVRAISPIYFVATKLEAFKGRGRGDFRSSHDLEDVLALLGQHPTLFDDIQKGSLPVCKYVRDELGQLSRSEAFLDAVPGAFTGDRHEQEVAALLTSKLLQLKKNS